MSVHLCSKKRCSETATRQTYDHSWEGDPWAPEQFVLWCAEHAPAGSWPAISSSSEGVVR